MFQSLFSWKYLLEEVLLLDFEKAEIVSILVFVEVSLRAIVRVFMNSSFDCFNPCFRGSIS